MAKRVCFCSLLTIFAMMLSFLESRFLLLPLAPGIKLGLANTVTLVLFAKGHLKEGLAVGTVRVLLSALLFSGVFSLAFSLSGAILSMLTVLLLRRFRAFSLVGLSIAGAAAHNFAQSGVYCLLFGGTGLLYYLAVLLFSGALTGLFTGLAATAINKKCGRLINQFWS